MTLREIAAIALDEVDFAEEKESRWTEDSSLSDHDKRFHPHGFKEGSACKLRRELSNDDEHDKVVSWSLGRDTDGKPGGVTVAICDITDEDTDAIVNAANRWMLGGGGVDGAIHRAAGPQLLEECKKYPPDENGYRVHTGDAKITGAGNLKAKYVIHTAGPDCREPGMGDEHDQDDALAISYKRSLEVAKENGCKSVAFPSISTGIFGFPVKRAAKIAAETITKFLSENPEMSVKMCIYDPVDSEGIAKEYTRAFQECERSLSSQAEAEKGGKFRSQTDNSASASASASNTAEDESPEVKNLRHLLRTNAISKKDFARGIAALAALGKISKGRLGLIKRQMFVEDAAPLTDLEKHDAKYHNGHYDGKSSCKYREDKAKGDNVDNLDPENVDGEEVEEKVKVEGQGQERTENSSSLANAVATAKDDLDAMLKGSNLKDIGDALSDYEKAYNAASGGKVVACLQGLLGKLKSQTGIVAKIVNQQIAQAKAQSATANLPQGTMTPDEARNYAALEIAKQLGANLTAPAATASVTSSSSGSSNANTASEPPAAPQPQPSTSTSSQTTYGPHAPLPHNFTQLPAGMNLDDFASWPRGGGSTGLRIYTDPNTGKKYGVKKSGGMPGGQNIPKQVMAEDWMADQALRMAGLNAPDGVLEVSPTDGEFYKVTEWNDNIKGGIGSSGAGHSSQLAEAYPMMAFLYNMDASQNGDNILVDNNGDLVFTDNGSSFGNRAQGGVNKWYVDRDDADSTKGGFGIAQLAQHDDQTMWANALGLGSITGTYGGTVGASDQDRILKEAAKYEMGKIARNVAAEMQQRTGIKPTDKKYQNMIKWADSLDKLSAKYKTNGANATSGSSQASASSTPVGQSSPSQGGHQGIWAKATVSQKVPNLYVDSRVPASFLNAFEAAANNKSILGQSHNYGISEVLASDGITPTGKFALRWLGPVGSPRRAQSFHGSQQAVTNAPNVAGYTKAMSPTLGTVIYTPNSQANTTASSSTGNTSAAPASQAAASQSQSGTPQSATMASNGSALLNQVGNSSWNTHSTGRALRNAVTIANAMSSLPSHQTQVANAFNAILQGQFTANGRGVGGTVTGVNIPRKGVQALQKAMNAHLAKSGLKVQIHNNGNVSIGATNKAIANAALSAAGQPTGGTTANDEAIATDEAPKGVFALALSETVE